MYKYWFNILFFVSCSLFTKAQDSLEVIQLNREEILAFNLPHVDTLVNNAIKYSPLVKFYGSNSAVAKAELDVQRKDWAYRIYSDAGYYYANNYSVLTTAAEGGGFESVSLGRGDVYRGGVTIRVSLFDLIGRKHLVQRAKKEYEATQYQIDDAEMEVRLQVRQLYTELKLTHKLIAIKSNTFNTLQTQLQMAEKQFKQGEIEIAELATVTEITARSQMAFEDAKAEYEKLYIKMEIIVGKSLATLQ